MTDREKQIEEMAKDLIDGKIVSKNICVGIAEELYNAGYRKEKHCCDCEYLEVYDEKDLYARCTRFNIDFRPFERDTRMFSCGEFSARWRVIQCNKTGIYVLR